VSVHLVLLSKSVAFAGTSARHIPLCFNLCSKGGGNEGCEACHLEQKTLIFEFCFCKYLSANFSLSDTLCCQIPKQINKEANRK
jgi:hypothetical protein